MPPKWPALARSIRQRDHHHCRRCGHHAAGGPVDHIIPRRLLVGDEVALEANLALLCNAPCHTPFKTMVLEPKLYQGDVLAFDQFLAILAQSGPVPSAALKGRAYERLTHWITHPADKGAF
jgi:hypothetical protein